MKVVRFPNATLVDHFTAGRSHQREWGILPVGLQLIDVLICISEMIHFKNMP
jgi:hypothetical protein